MILKCAVWSVTIFLNFSSLTLHSERNVHHVIEFILKG